MLWLHCQIATVLIVPSCAPYTRSSAAGPPDHAFPTATPTEELEIGLKDAGWGTLASRRFGLSMPLPERARWVVDDEREPWLVATHEPSRSELRLRIWTSPRNVTPLECETQARLWRPTLPQITQETTVFERRLDAPPGYHALLVVGVRATRGEFEGHALAFGASVGKCFAAAYTTRATGPSAEDAIGKRLALMVDGTLSRAQERSIDERVRPLRRP